MVTAGRIIREGLSDDFFNNIIDIDNFKEMWAKLKFVCSQVDQRVVYSILQEMLIYPKINKPKGYEKSITSMFVDVQILTKRLKAALTPGRNIYDSIAIVVALDSIHKILTPRRRTYLRQATRPLTRSNRFYPPPKLRTSANKPPTSWTT